MCISRLAVNKGGKDRREARANGRLGDRIVHADQRQIGLASIPARGQTALGDVTEAHASGLPPLHKHRGVENAIAGQQRSHAVSAGRADPAQNGAGLDIGIGVGGRNSGATGAVDNAVHEIDLRGGAQC